MKNKLIIILTIPIIIIAGFSGCNEQKVSFNANKIEIVDYTIETYNREIVGCCPKYVKVTDGFDYHLIDKYGYYSITGTIKNNAGKNLDEIFIYVKFYDKNGSYLTSEITTIFNLTDNSTDTFQIIYYNSFNYFEEIDNVKFEITKT